MPAEKHGDASSQYVEPGLLLLRHSQAALPETGFPAGLPARAGGWEEDGDGHRKRRSLAKERRGMDLGGGMDNGEWAIYK